MRFVLHRACVRGGVGVGVVVQQRAASEVDLYAVQTGAMGEAAAIGSLVITRGTDSPKVGDIITYELHSGKLITHRVAEVRDDQLLVTKGDTNESADPWRVELSSIRGVVQDVHPGAGYLWRFVTLPVGLASIASALITIVLAWRLFFPAEDERRLDLAPACVS